MVFVQGTCSWCWNPYSWVSLCQCTASCRCLLPVWKLDWFFHISLNQLECLYSSAESVFLCAFVWFLSASCCAFEYYLWLKYGSAELDVLHSWSPKLCTCTCLLTWTLLKHRCSFCITLQPWSWILNLWTPWVCLWMCLIKRTRVETSTGLCGSMQMSFLAPTPRVLCLLLTGQGEPAALSVILGSSSTK